MKLRTTIQLCLSVEEMSALTKAKDILMEMCTDIENEVGCGGCPIKNQCETAAALEEIIDIADIEEKE